MVLFTTYLVCAAAMVASHSLLSAPPVRSALLRHLGAPGFYTVYSTISLAALGALVWAYLGTGPGAWLYAPPPGARLAAVALMPLAVFLVVGRLTTRYGEAEAPAPPFGVYRLCRYPGSVGLLLWALLHLANVGDARRAVLFLSVVLICLFAIAKNDWLRRRAAEPHLAGTSIVPLAAVLAGRQRLAWREIGWRPLAIAAAVYAVLLFGHAHVIGADPLAF